MALNLNPTIFNKLHDTPQKSALFIGLGTIFLVLALFVFAIVPAVSSVISQYEKNIKRRELVDAQERKLNNLKRLIDLEQENMAAVDLLNENYPNFIDTEYVLRNINQHADNNNEIMIRNISIDEKITQMPSFVSSSEMSKYDRFDILAVEMSMTYFCSIEGTVNFLRYMENYPSIFNITKLNYAYTLGNNSENPANMPYSCNIVLSYYSRKAKPEPTIVPTVVQQNTGGDAVTKVDQVGE